MRHDVENVTFRDFRGYSLSHKSCFAQVTGDKLKLVERERN